MTSIPPIYFYIPESDLPVGGIPEDADIHWSGFKNAMLNSPLGNSVYCWTLQTYLRLKTDGFPCKLTGIIPNEGIILAHRSSLPFNLIPKPKQLIVCLKADHEQHPYAQLQVVQNPQDTKTVRDSYYISLWSQPGLIPRDLARGDRFENIAYFGIEKNLAPELRDSSWSEQLKSLGLRWLIASQERWNDYSDIDGIVAVRNFSDRESYNFKPATKLYNAWHAGVPAILGCDSAFQTERQSELDYLEVASVNDTIVALQRLRDDKELRYAMMENGRVRAEATQPEKLVSQWHTFITDVAIPAHNRWCNLSSLTQKIYLARRYLAVKENNLKPHPLYAHDHQYVVNEHIGIVDWGIISIMQIYRKVKKLLA
jgi:hypothetical protein